MPIPVANAKPCGMLMDCHAVWRDADGLHDCCAAVGVPAVLCSLTYFQLAVVLARLQPSTRPAEALMLAALVVAALTKCLIVAAPVALAREFA